MSFITCETLRYSTSANHKGNAILVHTFTEAMPYFKFCQHPVFSYTREMHFTAFSHIMFESALSIDLPKKKKKNMRSRSYQSRTKSTIKQVLM